ncbi:uncharacterized protein LOC113388454 [Ctenocephalides felis]|uniref:uncharacterized protein LOC113388454 n=1 Tax=Ctenocephalides felis TaxID=7515 RepID=UPI000E6E24B0|nr:uncharacterized protein LOC113388454 [Ctenocephalides felis]
MSKFPIKMFFTNFSENLFIYYDNLSWYLVITVFVTGVSALLTLLLHLEVPVIEWFERMFPFIYASPVSTKSQTSNTENNIRDTQDSMNDNTDKILLHNNDDADKLDIWDLNTVKRKTIFKDVNVKLTPEQKAEEEQAVKEQLAKIFALLKEQEDKFKVSDMEDLEEQLSLYKN